MVTKAQQHQFDLCHAYGHSMFESDSKVKSEIGYPTALQCERCDTVRTIILSIHGEITQTWYDYTDAYLKSLERKLSRQEARAEVLKHQKSYKRHLKAV